MESRASIFDLFHPAVALVYCGVALVFSMAVMQPVYLLLTFVGQLAFACVLRGLPALRGLLWQAPLIGVLAVANPLFVSVGSTELFRIGLHAVYAEALVFGLCQGLMLVNVLLTFSNAAHVISSDKVMAVLGNVAPTVSLMVSMTMRLVPQFARRGKVISAAQSACTAATLRTAPRVTAELVQASASSPSPAAYASSLSASSPSTPAFDSRARKRSFADRAANRLRLTTVLMGWGLEDSLETADAMRSRGWGAVRKRTSYQRYRFRRTDALACAVVAVLSLSAALAAVAALHAFAFYPRIAGIAPWFSYLPYAAFLALPLVVEVKERLSWR